MAITGSQKRENIKYTNYKVIAKKDKMAILLNKDTNIKEMWILNNKFAGYILEINGSGYEFAHSMPYGVIHANSGKILEDKTFDTEEKALNWWKSKYQEYSNDISIVIEQVGGF